MRGGGTHGNDWGEMRQHGEGGGVKADSNEELGGTVTCNQQGKEVGGQ